MQSERALSASALLMPLVFELHSAILFCGFAGGCADRQVFMNALRSSPFMSPALVLHCFILSCCELVAAGLVVSAAVSAATAAPQANRPASASTSSDFIGISLVGLTCLQASSGESTALARRAAMAACRAATRPAPLPPLRRAVQHGLWQNPPPRLALAGKMMFLQ